jgi:3-hydroxybutyryl-CoA dehydrogenase
MAISFAMAALNMNTNMNIDSKKIAVIGAGTMGGGIAQVAAQYGYAVVLEDAKKDYAMAGLAKIADRLEQRVGEGKIKSGEKEKILSRIKTSGSLKDCCDADLIIEAAIESEDIKIEIFKELDALCSKETVFATNTSSISITKLAQATGRPERFVGMHFMNPAYVMKLIEIIRGFRTSQETINMIREVAETMGKTCVVVNDSPGFVISRVILTMINDAIHCLHEGIAPREGIDTIMKLGANHPMGPFELADLMGLDICLEILEILHAELGEKYRPSPLLRQMVAAGKLGRKSGEGFYDYR